MSPQIWTKLYNCSSLSLKIEIIALSDIVLNSVTLGAHQDGQVDRSVTCESDLRGKTDICIKSKYKSHL